MNAIGTIREIMYATMRDTMPFSIGKFLLQIFQNPSVLLVDFAHSNFANARITIFSVNKIRYIPDSK